VENEEEGMRIVLKAMLLAGFSCAAMVAVSFAAQLEITGAVQTELDRQKVELAKWAADPTIVSAVKEHNAKGPIPDMDNGKWKTLRRSDPVVKALIEGPAGHVLKKRMQDSSGAIDKVFLNGAAGDKVAFAEKTISYLHKGQEKFDVPMSTGKPWQMSKPWFDESLQGYAVQIAVPVVADGKTIGVLVGSVPVAHLEKVAKK
jgi:hypothetical protein